MKENFLTQNKLDKKDDSDLNTVNENSNSSEEEDNYCKK